MCSEGKEISIRQQEWGKCVCGGVHFTLKSQKRFYLGRNGTDHERGEEKTARNGSGAEKLEGGQQKRGQKGFESQSTGASNLAGPEGTDAGVTKLVINESMERRDLWRRTSKRRRTGTGTPTSLIDLERRTSDLKGAVRTPLLCGKWDTSVRLHEKSLLAY